MVDIIEISGCIGAVVVLAYIFFRMYRAECKSHRDQMLQLVERIRDDRKFMEDRYTDVISKDQETRERETKAITRLTTSVGQMIKFLKAANGKTGAKKVK